MPIEQAKQWPVQFAEAIGVGTDLSRVWPRFVVWLLADPADGVIKFARTEKQRRAIGQVVALYARQLEGGVILPSEWRSVAVDAADAAAYAAYAADAAAYAAYAADAAAKQQSRMRQAAKLLDIIRSCSSSSSAKDR